MEHPRLHTPLQCFTQCSQQCNLSQLPQLLQQLHMCVMVQLSMSTWSRALPLHQHLSQGMVQSFHSCYMFGHLQCTFASRHASDFFHALVGHATAVICLTTCQVW